MPSSKSGTAGTADSPADPKPALEAIDGTSGDVSDTSANPAQTEAGNWDSVKITGGGEDSSSISSSSSDTQSSRNSWISIELKDKKGHPQPNEGYEIKLPDGTISSGTLDQRGRARVEGIPSGQCEVRFPRLHNSEWRKA